MAKMIDRKNKENKGESFVWDIFNENLPKNYIVYNNRTINAGEFDFCILVENMGVFVVEVKGWTADAVFDVVSQSEVIVSGYDKPQQNPLNQAKRYRYKILNYLKDELGLNILVMHLGAYPFISMEEFYGKRMDYLSEEYNTLFKEDFEHKEAIEKKLVEMWRLEKEKPHDILTGKNLALIRNLLEPSYELKSDDPILNPGYSRLRIFNSTLKSEKIDEIIKEYFSGVKEYVFLSDLNDLKAICTCLKEKFKEKNIAPKGNNIALNDNLDFEISTNGEYHAFNIDLFCIDECSSLDKCVIEEGNYTNKELDILKQLSSKSSFNIEQYIIEHKSVDHNILVKAGAGTGKTYSMISRIAFLCNRTKNYVSDISKDIAMITFTNDAADNMRKRIRQLFMNYFLLTKNSKYLRYLDDIENTKIVTIHKLVLSILRDNCLRIGLGNEFEITNEVYDQRMLYSEYLDKYLQRKIEENPDFVYQLHIRNFELVELLLDLSKQLYEKSEDVQKLCSEQLGNPPDIMPYFNELIEEVVVPAEKDYENQQKEANTLSLKRCMIALNNLLEKSDIQKGKLKYKYIFVDEFQDTDDVQIELIAGLKEVFGEKCRLFVVGDLKQSIYRFRGATLSAFDQIMKHGSEWDTCSLTRNYRTDNRLLNKYTKLFSYIGQRELVPYSEADNLYSSVVKEAKDEQLITRVETTFGDKKHYDSLYEELKKQIEQIESFEKERKLSAEEKIIAILVRENSQVSDVVSEMRKRGLSVDVVSGGDLYQTAPATDLLILVQAVTNPKNAAYLAELLSSNYIKAKRNYWVLKKGQLKKELIKTLDDHFLLVMEKTWEQVCKDFQTKPTLYMLRELYEASQPWKNYSSEERKQIYYKENYECLIEKLTAKHKSDYLTINRVCEDLQISITTWQEEQSRSNDEANGIRLLCSTIHKSKGLEYGTIVFPFSDVNLGQIRKNSVIANIENNKLEYRFTINGNVCQNSTFNDEIESFEQAKEEIRILYVAMTRAIRNFVWFHDPEKGDSSNLNRIMEVLE